MSGKYEKIFLRFRVFCFNRTREVVLELKDSRTTVRLINIQFLYKSKIVLVIFCLQSIVINEL